MPGRGSASGQVRVGRDAGSSSGGSVRLWSGVAVSGAGNRTVESEKASIPDLIESSESLVLGDPQS